MEEIYVRYGDMVKSVIYRVIPNVISADVDDLAQDIFIALLKSAEQFDGTKRLKPWLYGIAANKAADKRRSRWLHASLLKRHSDFEQIVRPSTNENTEAKMDLRQQLERAFEMLPKQQHDVMVLHAIEGFKGIEIAQILGIEVNTVWVRLHRARKTLLKTINETTKIV